MKATLALPTGYLPYFTFDLAKNKSLAIMINLAALFLFVVFGALFNWIAKTILPLERQTIWGDNTLVTLLLCGLAYMSMLVLHELIHGAFFWLFSRQRPQFGFKGAYAYAAAPEWYFPKFQYVMIGLAPLVLISLLGLLILPFLPAGVLLPWLIALSGNAGGAIGDVSVVGWLLSQPDTVLIQDHGDAVTAYRPS